MQGKTLSSLNRRLESQSLNQPVLVVDGAKLFQCPYEFRYRLEVTDPQQLLLEGPEEAFDTAVAFWLANESGEDSIPRKVSSFWKSSLVNREDRE